MSKQKIFKYGVLIIMLLAIFPAYVIFNKIKNDYALREYVKVQFIPELKNDFNSYLPSSGIDSIETTIRTLNIELNDSAILDLNNQIDDRLKKLSMGEVNLLGTSNWDYVKAKGFFGADTLNLKMRIRGDMPSNYNRGISDATFRLNVKGDKLLLGKKKLSIIRPEMESGYYGYLFYKCFREEGFLANHIEVIRFEINGEYVGLRFLQEGFSKELVESTFNREGPLFRFKGDCVDSEGRYNAHLLPELEAYKESKTLKTPGLSKNYARALGKYQEFINGNIEVGQCFNVEVFAKYYALCDVFLAHHSNLCQNVKLYFNPINDKFEPVAWDPSSYNRFEVNLPIFEGHNNRFGQICNNQRDYPLHYALARNDGFLERYVSHLNYYANNDVFMELINNYTAIITQTESEMFRQNFQQKFDVDNFYSTISDIKSDFLQEQQISANYYLSDSLLVVRSLSNLPLTIDTVKFKRQKIAINQMLIPNSLLKINVSFDSVPLGSKKMKVYSRVAGMDSQAKFKVKVFHSVDKKESTIFYERFDSSLFVFDYVDKTFKFKNKKMILTKDLYIPDLGMKWVVESGSDIELRNSNIVCESNIYSVGSSDQPIRFWSNSLGGVIFKNNTNKSTLKNSYFDGLSAPSSGNWFLTGAVTFYNTIVEIDSCTFKNNNSEDGLNLVSCQFVLSNSKLLNCMSDALDVDFGSGEINNILVNKSGNDALDFSGAQIFINGANLINVGDKGISGGEESTITCERVVIDKAVIGVASKDLSRVLVNGLKIVNTDYSCVAYQKKSQFGKSQIIINTSSPVSSNYIIEVGCLYLLNNEIMPANKTNVYEELY